MNGIPVFRVPVQKFAEIAGLSLKAKHSFQIFSTHSQHVRGKNIPVGFNNASITGVLVIRAKLGEFWRNSCKNFHPPSFLYITYI